MNEGRSLPWFRVDTDLVDHPKVDALCDRLSDPLAGWYVIRLWAWTMRYAARGRLAPGARLSVERACGWRGEAGHLWLALVAAGFLDPTDDGGAEVHDWTEHNGAAVVKAEKDAERKRESRNGARTARGRRADGAGRSMATGADRRADGAGNGTERDGTRQEALAPTASQPPLALVGEVSPKAPKKKPPFSDALCAAFADIRGVPYHWQGAKDGVALAGLMKTATEAEVHERWCRGLRATGWANVATVAQLASKWNDLAPPAQRFTHHGPTIVETSNDAF